MVAVRGGARAAPSWVLSNDYHAAMSTPMNGSADDEVKDERDAQAALDADLNGDMGDGVEREEEGEAIDEEIAEDAEPVEPHHSIDQLPDAVWHAPRGPLTRLFAWLILLLIVICLAAMIFAVIAAATT